MRTKVLDVLSLSNTRTTVNRLSLRKQYYWCRRHFAYGFYLFFNDFRLYFFFFFFNFVYRNDFFLTICSLFCIDTVSIHPQFHWITKTSFHPFPREISHFVLPFSRKQQIQCTIFRLYSADSPLNRLSPIEKVQNSVENCVYFSILFCCCCLLNIRSCDAVKWIHTIAWREWMKR